MIEGTFPETRYFSFQTYDSSLKPLSLLRDAKIKPVGNAPNPFATSPPVDGHRQKNKPTYRLYLTKDGKHGFPNEMAATSNNFAIQGLTILVMRLYGIDPQADLSHPEWEPWGYVPPIRVSSRVMGTVSPTAADLVWQTYPQCPLNNTLALRDAFTAIINVMSQLTFQFHLI